VLQYRPADYDPFSGRDKEPAYSPQRDLAWLFRGLAENVPGLLERPNVPKWIGQHLEDNRISQEQLQAAAAALLQGLDNFRDPDHASPHTALAASGFWDTPDSVKLPVLAALGLIITSFYFGAVREATVTPNRSIPKIVLASPQTLDALAIGKDKLQREPFYKRWLRKGGKL
jgi:hypothetical protein